MRSLLRLGKPVADGDDHAGEDPGDPAPGERAGDGRVVLLRGWRAVPLLSNHGPSSRGGRGSRVQSGDRDERLLGDGSHRCARMAPAVQGTRSGPFGEQRPAPLERGAQSSGRDRQAGGEGAWDPARDHQHRAARDGRRSVRRREAPLKRIGNHVPRTRDREAG